MILFLCATSAQYKKMWDNASASLATSSQNRAEAQTSTITLLKKTWESTFLKTINNYTKKKEQKCISLIFNSNKWLRKS